MTNPKASEDVFLLPDGAEGGLARLVRIVSQLAIAHSLTCVIKGQNVGEG